MLPENTLWVVVDAVGARLSASSLPCRCCGSTVRVAGASRSNFEYIGHRATPDLVPDTSRTSIAQLLAHRVDQPHHRSVRLTFTGVDEATDIVAAVWMLGGRGREGVAVELAALAGGADGDPRCASRDTRARLLTETRLAAGRGAAVGAALHLCGRIARDVNEGRHDEALRLCEDFGRVQINHPRRLAYNIAQIERFRERAATPVIIQKRTAFDGDAPSMRLHYLDDRSGGRGVDMQKFWRLPWLGVPCGYAGGVHAGNAAQAVKKVAGLGRSDAWIDVESGVRTNERFDIDKAAAVCDAAAGALEVDTPPLPPSPPPPTPVRPPCATPTAASWASAGVCRAVDRDSLNRDRVEHQ